MGVRKIKKSTSNVALEYSEFDRLDGEHPFMHSIPEGYVPYQVRELRRGEIAYFNFALAKEMGLIPLDHPERLTEGLRKKLIQTFSLQIINEYDIHQGRKFDPSTIKPKKYMASRYLQLQHANKQGKTSGDGRGIWNGVHRHKGVTWDVSSRGTGVTCLAPGSVEANRPLQTGAAEFGYGCGQAEIDELYAAALMAEILYLQGIPTERVLCVIDLGGGCGIGVRAAPNLLRPAHLFLYLKQNRENELKASLDYFIQRQIQNGRWKHKSKGAQIYWDLASEMSLSFAKFAAHLDVDYIFAWLDWDGDNVLADAGIIDYGSIRQFGLRHDQYRYDDVERFSTNLSEQKSKARLIVQVFCQIASYLQTGRKKPLKNFARHSLLKQFDETFARERADRILYRMGLDSQQRNRVLIEKKAFQKFDQLYRDLECAKVRGKIRKVPDGINRAALFDVRAIFRELPSQILKTGKPQVSSEQIFDWILSSEARGMDRKSYSKYRNKIEKFQKSYFELLRVGTGSDRPDKWLPSLMERARALNPAQRMTGNALIQVVDEILVQKKRGASHETIQSWMDQLIQDYLNLPEMNLSQFHHRGPRALQKPEVLEKLIQLIHEHRHDI